MTHAELKTCAGILEWSRRNVCLWPGCEAHLVPSNTVRFCNKHWQGAVRFKKKPCAECGTVLWEFHLDPDDLCLKCAEK